MAELASCLSLCVVDRRVVSSLFSVELLANAELELLAKLHEVRLRRRFV